MHHIITKTLLLLAIILAIVSMATPDWTLVDIVGSTKVNWGLFPCMWRGKRRQH